MPGKKYEVKLKDGYEYEFYDLSLEEAGELIEKFIGESLKDYEHIPSETKVYQLSDGRIIRTGYVDGVLYNSLEDFLVARQVLINKKLPKLPFIKYIHTTQGLKEYQVLTKKEGDSLEKQEEAVFLTKSNYRVISIGEELLMYGELNHSYKFKNYEDWISISQAWEEVMRKRPILYGRNPYGELFPEKVDELCVDLYRYLKMPIKSMSFDKATLHQIDRKLYSKVICDEYTEPLWLPLLAFIGKVVQLNDGGTWEMAYDEKYDTWSPNFRKRDGSLKMWYNDLDEIFDPFISDFIAIPKS